jgi:hypothetical protein
MVGQIAGYQTETQVANDKKTEENSYESVSKAVYEDVTAYTELNALKI